MSPAARRYWIGEVLLLDDVGVILLSRAEAVQKHQRDPGSVAVHAGDHPVDADEGAANSLADGLCGVEGRERRAERHGFADLKSWFQALYETLLGSPQGPRMGSFIALYGIENSRKLIADALAR